MRNTKTLSLFFLLLLLSTLTIDVPVNKAKATNYEVFTIAGASTCLSVTDVYNSYLFVGNGSSLLVYDLDTKTLFTTITIGEGITELLVKQDELYVEYTQSGATKYRYYTLPDLTLEGDANCVDWTSFNNVLSNLICIKANGKYYWSWSYSVGAPGNSIIRTTAKLDSVTAPRFISLMAHTNTGISVNTYFYVYVYNQTADTVSSLDYTYSSVKLAEKYWVYTIGCAADTTSQHSMSVSATPVAIMQDYFDTDTPYTFIPSSYYGYAGITVHATFPEFYTTATYFMAMLFEKPYDVYSARYIYQYSGSPTTLYVYPISISTGCGTPMGITLINTPIFTDGLHTWTCASYDDSNGATSIFVAFIKSTKIPVVEKVISDETIQVGILPEATYTPTSTRVFDSDKNIVAVWTQAASTSLYVCRNLIEDQYLASGGYGNTVVTPQLYRLNLDPVAGTMAIYTRWYQNASNVFTKLSGHRVYIYVKVGAGATTYMTYDTTDGNGQVALGYNVVEYPLIFSFKLNTTGYISTWLNYTLYNMNIPSHTCTTKERPVMSTSVTDETTNNQLIITMTLKRFSGEPWTSEYFSIMSTTYTLKVSNILEVTGEGYYKNHPTSASDVNDMAQTKASLAYNEGYAYRLTYYFDNAEQRAMYLNLTLDTQASWSYNPQTGEIVYGEFTTLPQTEATTTTWTTTAQSFTTFEDYIGLVTNNQGFVLVLIVFTALTFFMATLGSSVGALIFGFCDAGLMLGFAGYVGLLPFPIFIFALLVLALGTTLVFSRLLGASGRTER